jgi:predicted nuclease with TOPRIM domain
MKSYKVVNIKNNKCSDVELIQLLEKEVNTLIEQGWSCIGGVSIIKLPEYSYMTISQTMIKNNQVLDEQTKQNQELLSKLEEQVKLNGELCKRLFELKN